jgi:replication-associated recombination protein RarA
MAATTSGTLLQQLFTLAQKFLNDPKNNALFASITAFLKGLSRADITQLVADIDAKQAALVGTGTLGDLSQDQLILYATLGDARAELTGTDLAAAMTADVGTWFVTSGVPMLMALAKVALPLLVMA